MGTVGVILAIVYLIGDADAALSTIFVIAFFYFLGKFAFRADRIERALRRIARALRKKFNRWIDEEHKRP